MKLVKNDLHLLLIDEEAEIKDCYYYNSLDKAIRKNNNINHPYHHKIIAYYPLTKEAKELDLPLLPEFDIVDTVVQTRNFNKQIKNPYSVEEKWYQVWERAYIEGYNDGVLQSKQFSLQDMETLMEEALNWFGGGRDENISDSKEFFEKYIQSLSTQQLPVSFEPEYNGGGEYLAGECGGNEIWAEYPKQFKTTTNSESKEVLVGTYKY